MGGALELEMAAGGESTPNAKVGPEKVSAGFEAKTTSTKSLSFTVKQIPELDACIQRGYMPQLGIDGCLPRKPDSDGVGCTLATPKELLTVISDEKSIRLKAAADLSCAGGPIQVRLVKFTQAASKYQAAGCGQSRQYSVTESVGMPASSGQPAQVKRVVQLDAAIAGETVP